MKKLFLLPMLIILLLGLIANGQDIKNEKKKSVTSLKTQLIALQKKIPDIRKINESGILSENGKIFYKMLRSLADEANNITDSTTIETYNSIMRELEWAMLIINISTQEETENQTPNVTSKSEKGNSSKANSSWAVVNPGNGIRPVRDRCTNGYNYCIAKEHRCKRSGFSNRETCSHCTDCMLNRVACNMSNLPNILQDIIGGIQ